MSSEWPILELGSLTINYDGRRKPVKESERKPGPYPYYGASGIVDHVDGYIFDGSYLLIGEDGENMRTRQTPIAFLAHGKFWVNNHAHIVTGNHLADTRFLMYSILNADIHSYLTGAVMPKLTQGNLNRILLACPPIDVQRGVASVLGALDDRIFLLRQINGTLEAIAQALFKSWFMDFDPVRAKQDGRVPEGMDEATASLFPHSLDEWKSIVPRLSTQVLLQNGILQIGDGYRAKNSELGLPGVPFVRAGDLNQGQLTPTRDHLMIEVFAQVGAKQAKLGDTAFTSKGTIGRFAYADESAKSAVYSPQVCFWRSLDWEKLDPVYLHFWMKSSAFSVQIDAVSGQAAIMEFVSLTSQRRMVLDFPPIAMQKRFSEISRNALEEISNNRALITSLTEIRDTLLPNLISGRLRLPEAAEIVDQLKTGT